LRQTITDVSVSPVARPGKNIKKQENANNSWMRGPSPDFLFVVDSYYVYDSSGIGGLGRRCVVQKLFRNRVFGNTQKSGFFDGNPFPGMLFRFKWVRSKHNRITHMSSSSCGTSRFEFGCYSTKTIFRVFRKPHDIWIPGGMTLRRCRPWLQRTTRINYLSFAG
jgi:hypothetical protein